VWSMNRRQSHRNESAKVAEYFPPQTWPKRLVHWINRHELAGSVLDGDEHVSVQFKVMQRLVEL
jgi:hypothetical protein